MLLCGLLFDDDTLVGLLMGKTAERELGPNRLTGSIPTSITSANKLSYLYVDSFLLGEF